ncbi:MAG: glycosyltransferase family 39 protein [Anaerolineae bacterium]|nr:glycosyltransferase family 39 protein [Anaerolineae bacterium]
MEEPSILDYLKAKLMPWRGPAPEIPPIPSEKQEKPSVRKTAPIDPAEQSFPELVLADLPWRMFVVLILVLVAQRSLDSLAPRFSPGTDQGVIYKNAALFVIAIGLAAWSYFRGEWLLAKAADDEPVSDPLTARRTDLLLGMGFSVLAFIAFGGNQFNSFNVFLWVMGFWFLTRAFWLSDPQSEPWHVRLRSFLTRPAWNVSISRWTLLLVGVMLFSAFFRLYRLGQVPPEMTSDHAEKLLDVYDILQGKMSIFFRRNTGREPFHIYLTAWVFSVFKLGFSFLNLKIPTTVAGVIGLPYMYLLGKELGNRKVGLLAMAFTGIAYWPNVIARFDLRIIFHPFFVAPVMYYLLRGLRSGQRNNFILAGVALGVGLNGYTPFRVMPLVVLAAVGFYLLHRQSQGKRSQALFGLVLLAFFALILFLPLLRYALQETSLFPGQEPMFNYRSLTRMTSLERPLPGPAWQIFLKNLWAALAMFNWRNGTIWVHSVPNRPAVDVVSAAFFVLGAALLIIRYIHKRYWQDIFLLFSIPILLLPSILSLAFPDENPNLNRTSGAIVPVFLIVALGMEGLLRGIKNKMGPDLGKRVSVGLAGVLFAWAAIQNYGLVFDNYYEQYRSSSWNTSELGAVIGNFAETVGDKDSAWVVAFPHWVDNRLVGMHAGYPGKTYEIWPEDIASRTLDVPAPKLFLVKPEDQEALRILRELYPQGASSLYDSEIDNKDFYIFFVPADTAQ